MNQKYLGSCLCGDIRFEVSGDFESFFLCHCKYCQKDTGSAHAANLFSSKAELTWLKGEEKAKVFCLPSTRHAKSFCSNCGSALPNYDTKLCTLVVPAGCLDSKVSIVPNAHIFVGSRAEWEQDLERVVKINGLPEE